MSARACDAGPRLSSFEPLRPTLLGLAYRMLGDFQRAEDTVQETWLRWSRWQEPVENPKAFLIKTVTRLCLNELGSARARREESRADRLPEPVNLGAHGLCRVEAMEAVSMAFLVLLQRLTCAERAVLLLRDVFEMEFAEIAELVRKSEPACRQLLVRAREHVGAERRQLQVSREVHQRVLRAFVQAAVSGDAEQLARLLSEDVVLIADAGPGGGTFGRVRNLPGPLVGSSKVAAFVAAVTPQGVAGLSTQECEINCWPAMVVLRGPTPVTVISLSVADDLIRSIFFHADAARLGHVGL